MTSKLYIIDGESYERSVSVKDGIVTRKHVTEHKSGKVYLTWHFDFADVTAAQVMELASRAVLIGERPKFKKVPDGDIDSWGNKIFHVADFLSRERSKATPLEKARNLAAGLSPEDAEALLEQLRSTVER